VPVCGRPAIITGVVVGIVRIGTLSAETETQPKQEWNPKVKTEPATMGWSLQSRAGENKTDTEEGA
jgi:hypothetical protein